MLVRVKSKIRQIKYFRHGDPINKDKITGCGYKSFLDIHTTTRYDATGHKDKETFTAHVYRGELRVMVAGYGRKATRESMSESDFVKYAERRWCEKAAQVLELLSQIKEPA